MIEGYVAINLMADHKTGNFYCSECEYIFRGGEFYEASDERWYDGVEFLYCPSCGREILNSCISQHDKLVEEMKKEINDGMFNEDTRGTKSPEKSV